MASKNKPPEGLGGESRGLHRKDRIERLSILKKDSKGFASRILQDDSVILLAGREKSNILHRIKSCADWITVRYLLLTGKSKVIQARLCRNHLLCSFCAALRAAKLIQKYIKVYKQIVGNQKSYHIVFTVKDGPDLQERFNHLNSSISSFLKDRRRGNNELSKITSGIYSYEIIKGKNSGDWHPHLHMIALTSEFINFSNLRAEWKETTKDSFEVNVTEFYGNDTKETFTKPFFEVFKYSLKHSELSDSERIQAYKILKGRKLTNSFGEFRGFIEPINILEEVSKDDVFFMDTILNYDDKNKSYIPSPIIEFSKEFKAIFKLQEAYKKYGDRVINQFFDPYAFDLLQKRTGIDFRLGMIEMIKSNIKGEEEIRNYFLKNYNGGEKEFKHLEEPPELLAEAPEAETDIHERIFNELYNETDEKKG